MFTVREMEGRRVETLSMEIVPVAENSRTEIDERQRVSG